VVFTTHIVAVVIAFGLKLSDTASMLSLFITPFEVAGRILDAPTARTAATSTPNVTVFLAALAWTALFSVLVYARYARLQVTR